MLSFSYLGYFKPFESKLSNLLEVYNEYTILLGKLFISNYYIAGYHLLTFTDYVNNTDIQYILGFSLIAAVTLNILINTIVMIVMTIKNII
jgi:hypothetical protein